ncbi:hypothetical protein ACFC1I_18030 [Microbacterium sp. NPDC056044]|uniref:hypothetical protein n=1 Tax=Microbacterium sp. NPDC056044 TaxID=3345690 RepID=UPI0035D876B4
MIDPDDERTALSRRSAPAPAPAAGPRADADDALDDRTLPSRRGGRRAAGAADRAPDLPVDLDATAVSSRSSASSETGLPMPAATSDSGIPTQAATASAQPGPRRGAHTPEDPRSGATIVARGRRGPVTADPRTAEGERPATDAPAPLGRVAHRPEAERVVYPARAVPPTTVPRGEPARREPQQYVDTAAADAARRRRRRRRAIAVVAAASVLLVAGAILLVVLVTGG